jgi:glycosyltransferase involved in cell wall biosynthesis
MIRFTLVTVTYNAASVLKPTIDSVLMQSYADVEHLIIDGASTDGTLKMAEEYKIASDASGKGHVVRILSEPDKGIYDAMQKGLDRAQGDYVCFLNAGDRLPDADTLLTMADKIDTEQLPGVLYGNTDIVDEHGEFLYHRRLSPPKKLHWKSFRQGMLVCHQAFYALTSIAKAVPYDLRYRYSADVDWCIRVMKEAERLQLPLMNTHTVLAHYLEEGQTTLHHRDSLKERFDVMRRHYGLFSTVIMHIWFVFRQLLRK